MAASKILDMFECFCWPIGGLFGQPDKYCDGRLLNTVMPILFLIDSDKSANVSFGQRVMSPHGTGPLTNKAPGTGEGSYPQINLVQIGPFIKEPDFIPN